MSSEKLMTRIKREAAEALLAVRYTAESIREGEEQPDREDRVNWHEDSVRLMALMRLMPETEGRWTMDTIKRGESGIRRQPIPEENEIPHLVEMIHVSTRETLEENADHDDEKVLEAASYAHTRCIELTEALKYRMGFRPSLKAAKNAMTGPSTAELAVTVDGAEFRSSAAPGEPGPVAAVLDALQLLWRDKAGGGREAIKRCPPPWIYTNPGEIADRNPKQIDPGDDASSRFIPADITADDACEVVEAIARRLPASRRRGLQARITNGTE